MRSWMLGMAGGLTVCLVVYAVSELSIRGILRSATRPRR